VLTVVLQHRHSDDVTHSLGSVLCSVLRTSREQNAFHQLYRHAITTSLILDDLSETSLPEVALPEVAPKHELEITGTY
jgi:hypothetical protein